MKLVVAALSLLCFIQGLGAVPWYAALLHIVEDVSASPGDPFDLSLPVDAAETLTSFSDSALAYRTHLSASDSRLTNITGSNLALIDEAFKVSSAARSDSNLFFQSAMQLYLVGLGRSEAVQVLGIFSDVTGLYGEYVASGNRAADLGRKVYELRAKAGAGEEDSVAAVVVKMAAAVLVASARYAESARAAAAAAPGPSEQLQASLQGEGYNTTTW